MNLRNPLVLTLTTALLFAACGGKKDADDDNDNGGESGSGGTSTSGGNGGTGGGSGGTTGGGTSGGNGGTTGGGTSGGTGGTGGTGVPATCSEPPTVTGQLGNPIAAVDFTGEPADVFVVHKIDIDEGEDGCISSVDLTVRKAGQGCELKLGWTTNGDMSALELATAEFTADSFCPGWSDADEGLYALVAESGATLDITSKVPDRTAETSCFTTQLHLRGSMTMRRSDDTTLEMTLAGLVVSGDFQSTGNTDASCPVPPVGTGGTGGVGGTGGGGVGGATGGTGGATGGVGGTGGTGGTGGITTCGAAFHSGERGYVTTPALGGGCWRGHAYTSAPVAGSSISPTDFSTCTDPCSLCASGSVAADIDYAGIALLGFNLAQELDTETAGTVVPTGSGLLVNFTNSGGSALRVQIAGPNAATLASDRWCVEVSGTAGSVMIPWTSFNTTCWDGLGTYYAREPLMGIQLLVPGDDTLATSFAMCMNSVTEY